MKKNLLLAIAVVGTLSFAASARAGDGLMSPKAREQAESLRRVPGTTQGTTPDMIDRPIQSGSPKQVELAASLRRVPGTGSGVDLAHAPRPDLRAKDPNYDLAFRNNAVKQVDLQIAPLK